MAALLASRVPQHTVASLALTLPLRRAPPLVLNFADAAVASSLQRAVAHGLDNESSFYLGLVSSVLHGPAWPMAHERPCIACMLWCTALEQRQHVCSPTGAAPLTAAA